MLISQRLKAVAESVTVGNRVADVGCDHAYISIYLIENNISPFVIAMDVNKGPLERAKKNIAQRGYGNHIDVRLSDGLHKMKAGEAETILIAGMGGALTMKILEEGAEAVRKSKELVLQAQSELHLVRNYIHQIGFHIRNEQMLKEDGKYYVIIKAVPSEKTEQYEREVFYQYGKLLLEQREPIVREYLAKEKILRLQVLEHLAQNPSEQTKERQKEIEQELDYIEEGFAYFNE